MSVQQASRTGQTGSVDSARTENPRRVPYPFVARPKSFKALLKAKKVNHTDGDVLDVLLNLRIRFVSSCWCSKATIAAELGIKSPRTVQRSLYRLWKAGLIEQRPVPKPDPDEPRNKTGWRIIFPWIPGGEYGPGPGPIRTGFGLRKTARGETILSPLSESELSPPPETDLSPKYYARGSLSDQPELDGTYPEGDTPTSSSSPPAHATAPPAEASAPDDDDFASHTLEEQQVAELGAVAELPNVEANAAAESPAPPDAEVVTLAEAIEEVRQAHGAADADAILASIPGHERTLHVDQSRIVAAVRTIAEREPGSFTTSAVAYFASVMRDVPHWPRARVRAKIDRTRARPVVELSDDAKRLKSIREAYGGSEKHGHDHMIWNQGWSEARHDQAAAELGGSSP